MVLLTVDSIILKPSPPESSMKDDCKAEINWHLKTTAFAEHPLL